MKQYQENHTGCLIMFCLLACIGIAVGLLLWRNEMQKDKAPPVSVQCSRVSIYENNSLQYTLVAAYVFTNNGDESVTFAECFDTAAYLDGKPCDEVYVEIDTGGTDAERTVVPGQTVVIQIPFALKDFIPKKSAEISLRLYDRMHDGELIEQVDKDASGITIQNEGGKCYDCCA